MEERFERAGGLKTRLLCSGQAGEAVFFLHGIGLSADCFLRNLDPLGASFRAIAPDLIGHGFTDAAPFRGEAPQVVMARHLLALADTLGLEAFSVVGSSFGAHVAAHAFLMHPGRVRRMCLVASGSVFHSNEEQKATLRASLANGRSAMADPSLEACAKRMARIVFDAACVPPGMLERQLESYRLPDRLSAYEDAIQGAIETMDGPAARVLGRLEDLRCPVLVMVGENDIRADLAAHREGAARMPDARLSTYARCGHLPFLEYPERFNDEAGRFLSGAG